MEDIERAVHETVLDAGAKVLAPKMGLSHTALLQRSNPNCDDHKLTLAQFYQVNLHSGDHRSLRAMATDFGYELQGGYVVEEKTPLQALMDNLRHSASTTQVVMSALEDNTLSAQELRDIETAVANEMRTLQALLGAVRPSQNVQRIG
jgi:hypothetical protein